MKRLTLVLVIIAAAVLTIGYPNKIYSAEEGKKVIKLKISYHQGPTHLIARGIEESFAPLEKMSGGRVEVKFFGSGTLAAGKEAYERTVGGAVDIAHIATTYWPGRFPLISVCELPDIFNSAVIGTLAMNKFVNTVPYVKKEFSDVQPLSWYTTSVYYLLLKKKITSIDGFKGLRLRSAGGMQNKTIERLGASPIFLDSGEIPSSLGRGLLDGLPFNVASIPVYRYQEVAGYLVDNLRFGLIPQGLIMNKDSWAKLPSDIKAMVEECAMNAAIRIAMQFDNEEALAFSFLRNKLEIYSFSPAETGKFYAALEPLRNTWVDDKEAKGLQGKETLNALLKIRDGLTLKWK